MSPRAVGQSSCARQSFNPKPLLRVSYNLLHKVTHKFPRTKHIWSSQQDRNVNGGLLVYFRKMAPVKELKEYSFPLVLSVTS